MTHDSEQICVAVRKLIAFLRSFDGDDRDQGLQAAQNFEHTLAILILDFESGVGRLACDVGGKGMLDWRWSDKHRIQIEQFSEQIFGLLYPHSTGAKR